MTTKKPDAAQLLAAKRAESPAFNDMVNLLAVFSDATSRLAELEASANSALLEIIDDHKADYAKLQEACMKAEAALETICRSHPEWFVGTKSLTTPYGKVAFKNSSSLEVKDDEATVRLIKAEHALTTKQRFVDGKSPIFDSNDYIRTVELPNLEALELLDDSTLEKFMIKRVKKDSFSVKAASIDFGKAVKSAVDPAKN